MSEATINYPCNGGGEVRVKLPSSATTGQFGPDLDEFVEGLRTMFGNAIDVPAGEYAVDIVIDASKKPPKWIEESVRKVARLIGDEYGYSVNVVPC